MENKRIEPSASTLSFTVTAPDRYLYIYKHSQAMHCTDLTLIAAGCRYSIQSPRAAVYHDDCSAPNFSHLVIHNIVIRNTLYRDQMKVNRAELDPSEPEARACWLDIYYLQCCISSRDNLTL